jgi:NADH-quinone oxidoreductase subunit I
MPSVGTPSSVPGPAASGQRPGAGRGLLAGLATTARALVHPAHTAEYPDVRPDLPPRSRGVIALLTENCTSCMLCARECPDWCIYIDSHKEEVPAAEPGGRARQRNVLDRFAIDFSLCMYCGICIEVCPFDALFWSPEFEYAEFDIRNLLHEAERLSGWMESVPPPPLPDAGAPEAKEVSVARAAAEKALAAHEAEQRAAAPAGTAGTPARPPRIPLGPHKPTEPVEPTEPVDPTEPAEPGKAGPSEES